MPGLDKRGSDSAMKICMCVFGFGKFFNFPILRVSWTVKPLSNFAPIVATNDLYVEIILVLILRKLCSPLKMSVHKILKINHLLFPPEDQIVTG